MLVPLTLLAPLHLLIPILALASGLEVQRTPGPPQTLDRFTCEEVFQRINDYLDRELSAAEMALVREHLDTCVVCAGEYAFEGRVLDDLKAKLRRIDLPASVLANVQAILSDPKNRKP